MNRIALKELLVREYGTSKSMTMRHDRMSVIRQSLHSKEGCGSAPVKPLALSGLANTSMESRICRLLWYMFKENSWLLVIQGNLYMEL